jgi:hypothetical protein
MAEKSPLSPGHQIENRIILLHGQRVILSFHLAEMYDVETKVLIQSVKRHLNRFPEDFMFPLTELEWSNLRSQIVTSSWGGRRYPPYAFTEQGVAMLSSILNSPRAIQVNIEIIRTFVKLRSLIASHSELAQKLDALERKYDKQFAVVFDAIRQLMQPLNAKPKRPIGFLKKE